MITYPSFKHKTLTVIEVPLTDDEIKECLEMGKKRTELDEEKLGWKYRHHGMKSELAHAIGLMGETAFEKWLDSEGLKQDVDYLRGKVFVERLEDIRQDYEILGKVVGVKSAKNRSLDEATSFGTFLYPAKPAGKSKRVLPYPDLLVQTVVSVEGKQCWLCGHTDADTVRNSPTQTIHGEPAHMIPIAKYRPVKELISVLRSSRLLDS